MAKEQQAPQQQVHPAAAAAEFMQRSDLKGGEVEVFAQTFNWLQSILNGEMVVIPQQVFADLQEKVAAYSAKYGELEEEDAKPEGEGGDDNHGLPPGAKFIPDAAKAEAHKPA